jgi:hypothetical protein
MKGKIVFGALLVSVALASQGFGFDLLDRARGLNCGGCGACAACAAPACAPCAPKACAPEACGKPACERCCRRCDLFAGLKDLFACPRCGKVRCTCEAACKPCEQVKACAPACKACERVRACCPEPVCKPCERVRACAPACKPCERVRACAPACKACEKVGACEQCGCRERPCRCHRPLICKAECGPYCRPKLGHGLIVSVLDDLFGCKKCGTCGEGACGACGECGCGGVPAKAAPAKAADAAPIGPAEDVGPLPIPPTADPSASLMRPRSIYQASRSVVQN